MILHNPQYKPVLNHESIQVIMPFELFKVTDANTKEILWYEVTYKEPKTFEQYGRRAFTTESNARDYIINTIENKHHSAN